MKGFLGFTVFWIFGFSFGGSGSLGCLGLRIFFDLGFLGFRASRAFFRVFSHFGV